MKVYPIYPLGFVVLVAVNLYFFIYTFFYFYILDPQHLLVLNGESFSSQSITFVWVFGTEQKSCLVPKGANLTHLRTPLTLHEANLSGKEACLLGDMCAIYLGLH